MGRRVFFVGLWIVATVGIGLAARAAVSFVDRAVFPEGQAIRVVDLPPPSTTTTTQAPVSTVIALPETSTTTSSTTTTTVLTPITTSTIAATVPTVPETTTTSTSSTTTTSIVTSPTTTVPAVRTVVAAGGSVTIQSSVNAVTLVSFVANAGFVGEVVDEGPAHVEVLFHPETGPGTSYVRCDAGPKTAVCDAA